MKNFLSLSPSAQSDASDALLWYDGIRPVLARSFRIELRRVLARVTDSPLIFPVTGLQLRRALLRQFPYAIYFRVTGHVIQVLAILHNNRDPAEIERRH